MNHVCPICARAVDKDGNPVRTPELHAPTKLTACIGHAAQLRSEKYRMAREAGTRDRLTEGDRKAVGGSPLSFQAGGGSKCRFALTMQQNAFSGTRRRLAFCPITGQNKKTGQAHRLARSPNRPG
jgi:hypothetical protein